MPVDGGEKGNDRRRISHRYQDASGAEGATRRVGVTLAVHRPAGAQSAEELYRGKQIDLIIGYSPGRAYEVCARLIVGALPRVISGLRRIISKDGAR